MRLLLDTHVFLWFISGDQRLKRKPREALVAHENEVFLSAVSIWECLIKHQQGKLAFPASPEIYLPQQRLRHRIRPLPIDEACVRHLLTLPPMHRDPFDRILVCQALEHGLTIVTVDPIIRSYSVPCFLD